MKLLKKIASLGFGLAMAIGVGASLGKSEVKKEAKAATDTTVYKLITSTADLEAGKSYVITSGTNGSVKAMSKTTNSNNRKIVDITISDNKFTSTADVLRLTLGGQSGAWTFYTENYETNGYLASASSGKNNYCRVIADSTAATISFSANGDAVINIAPHTERNLLMYNSSSSCFACYTGGQSVVYLFKETNEAPSTDCTVTYQANNATSGTAPTDSTKYTKDATVTVLGNTGNLAKTGHEFGGWNTKADGSGTTYAPGSTFTITANTNLYALWIPNQMSLKYDVNGGTGTVPADATYDYGTKVTIDDGSNISLSGKVFDGWNTKADGTGTAYQGAGSITMNDNFILFAQWADEPVGFDLVTDASTLQPGDLLMFGCATKSVGAGVMDNKVLSSVGASFANGVMTSPSALVFTLGGQEGAWTFSNNDKTLGVTEVKKLAWGSGTDTFTITISSEGAATITSTASEFGTMYYNSGSPRFTTYTTPQTGIELYRDSSSQASVVSISSVSADVSAVTGDTQWTLEDVEVTGVLDNSPDVVDITKYVNVSVLEAVPQIKVDGTMNVTLKAVANGDPSITKSVSAVATLTYVNQYSLARIYTMEKGDIVTIDAIYMGDVRDAIIVMDGEFGADVYYGAGNVPQHDYKAGKTYLTITGTIDIYHGLYEVKPTNVGVLTDADRIANLKVPELYIVTGEEEADDSYLAARKTNATGYVTSISDASGNKNVNLSVNGHTVALFFGSNYVTDPLMDKLNDSKENYTIITVEGFTSFHDGFQVTCTGIIEAKDDYLAEDFGADVLSFTDVICEGYDGRTDNSEALKAMWLVLANADHYLGLAQAEKDKVVAAEANEKGTDLEKAMARYDYLVVKYGLANFIGRANLELSSYAIDNLNTTNNNSTLLIVIISVASVSLIGLVLIAKKKRTIK